MFSNFILTLLSIAPDVSTRALDDPTMLTKVTSTTESIIYEVNTTTSFCVGVQMIIFGISLFLIPKYSYKLFPTSISPIFSWTGIWLFVAGIARLNYALIMLNIDQQYPFLYYTLPIFRIISLILGTVTLILYFLYYSKIGKLNELSKELDRSQRKFEAIVSSTNDAIIITNTENDIHHWNLAAERIFGWAPEEVKDKKLDIIIPPSLRERHNAGMKRYLETRVPTFIGKTFEMPGLHKDGHEFPVEISLSTYGLDGSTFFTAVIRDISVRRELEKKVTTLSNKIKKDSK